MPCDIVDVCLGMVIRWQLRWVGAWCLAMMIHSVWCSAMGLEVCFSAFAIVAMRCFAKDDRRGRVR